MASCLTRPPSASVRAAQTVTKQQPADFPGPAQPKAVPRLTNHHAKRPGERTHIGGMLGVNLAPTTACAAARASAQAPQACAAGPQSQPARRCAGMAQGASAYMGGAQRAAGLAASGPSRRRGCSSRGSLQVTNVIPMIQGDASQQLPPDLPSYLFKERIVYMVRQLPLATRGLHRLGCVRCASMTISTSIPSRTHRLRPG